MRQWYGVGLAIGLVCVGCYGDPALVELTGEDSGRHVLLAFHQDVELKLQTIGPGRFGEPAISSGAVRFEGMSFSPMQNPGGPTQLYRFRSVANGDAMVTIPHEGEQAPFTITFMCCPQ